MSEQIERWGYGGPFGYGHLITSADGTRQIAVTYGQSVNPRAAQDTLLAVNAPRVMDALLAAIRIAKEARQEWDKAPSSMRAGKILIALSGSLPGYRADIDEIHAALVAADPSRPYGDRP